MRGFLNGYPALTNDPADPVNLGFPVSSFGTPWASTSAAAPAPSPASSAGKPTLAQGLHPDSGLFWFGVIAAITFGAVGFQAHARVLNVRGGVDVGKA